MLALWVYKRVWLLLAAYGGILGSLTMFPNSPIWSLSSFIGEVIFSPFKLLLAVFLFVVGFLAYSLFVRDIIRIWNPDYKVSLRTPRLLFVIMASLSWFHLLITNWRVALFALVLASWYGIMDVKFESYR
ncbi:hypothetical protein [Halalkalibacter lacteus]|uniref:hypothetical protein n=1 Tax=Halalkalibacter lacteus TaxID=3090663 RepID=UPI002FC9FC43